MNKVNLFIVGAAKAGTTSLYQYLTSHPNIYMSHVKEPHFFTSKIKKKKYEIHEDDIEPRQEYHSVLIRKLENYQKLYNNQTEKILGDASPSYLWDEQAPVNIAQYNPDAKIIIMLRDPINRAYSHYLMEYANGFEKHECFQEALKADQDISGEKYWGGECFLYTDLGLYSTQIARYFKHFSSTSIKIVIFEEFIAKPEKGLKEIADFLGVAFEEFPNKVFEQQFNPYKSPTNKISLWVMRNKHHLFQIKEMFPPHIRERVKSLFLSTKAKKKEIPEDVRKELHGLFKPDIISLKKYIDPSKLSYFKNFKLDGE